MARAAAATAAPARQPARQPARRQPAPARQPSRRPAAPTRRPQRRAAGGSTARKRRSATNRLPLGARLLDALLSGRVWIGLVGVLLAGIVFFNVDLMRMNREITHVANRAAQVKRENAGLRQDVAQLANSERIQEAAAELGLVLPAPDQVRYLKSNPRIDARTASKRIIAPTPSDAPDPAATTPPTTTTSPTTTTTTPPTTTTATPPTTTTTPPATATAASPTG
jgi:cell division protein FtsL